MSKTETGEERRVRNMREVERQIEIVREKRVKRTKWKGERNKEKRSRKKK